MEQVEIKDNVLIINTYSVKANIYINNFLLLKNKAALKKLFTYHYLIKEVLTDYILKDDLKNKTDELIQIYQNQMGTLTDSKKKALKNRLLKNMEYIEAL